MIKLFCDLCEKEIINQDYVEQSIFNHFDFEDSVEAIICKKCWGEQSPTSQTKSSNEDFPNGEHNMGDKVTATPSPKSPTATSHHPNIMPNSWGELQALSNLNKEVCD